MKILSINISEPKKIIFNGKELITSIYKKPIDGLVNVGDVGIDGDLQADLKVHGGYDKAIYAYSFQHYKFWSEKLNQDFNDFGLVGENLTIDDFNEKDLNSYLDTIGKNIGLNDLTLKDHFKKYGANYDYFVSKTVINLKWNSLIFSLYKKQLDVDEELIKSELSQVIKENREIIEYNLSEIVLENSDQKKVNLILQNINDNGFENTASIYSNSVSSTNKGLIGWIASSSISKDYLQEITKLEIGQISEPIQQQNNLVLIKLNNKRILKEKNLDVERIEKNIINKKKEEKLNIFSNSHYVNLEKKTFIEINE